MSVALSWSLFSTVVASQREIRFLLTSVLCGDPRVYCVKSFSRKELDATFCFHPLLGCNFSWFDYFWLLKKLIKNIKERKGKERKLSWFVISFLCKTTKEPVPDSGSSYFWLVQRMHALIMKIIKPHTLSLILHFSVQRYHIIMMFMCWEFYRL